MNSLTTCIEPADTPDAAMLIAALSRELAERYPEDAKDGTAGFDPRSLDGPGSAFVVARWDGTAVGCGAVRPFSDQRPDRSERSGRLSGELKRMFVLPTHRGRGISKAILAALEDAACAFGYSELVLETGVRQPEAVALYKRMGYARILCWPQYQDNAWSVCMRKKIIHEGQEETRRTI